MQVQHPPQPRSVPTAGKVLLAVVPWVTAGFAAWLPALVVAVTTRARRRAFMLAVAAATAVLAFTGGAMLTSTPDSEADQVVRDDVGFALLLVVCAAGTAVALLGWRTAGDTPAGSASPAWAAPPAWAPPPAWSAPQPRATGAHGDLPGVAEAMARRQMRQRYRQLAADDPVVAREIGVGRPDVQRRIDDAGLLDLNTLNAAALQQYGELAPQQAAAVVATRERLGPLSSVDELVVHAGLAPDTAERLREYAVFIR